MIGREREKAMKQKIKRYKAMINTIDYDYYYYSLSTVVLILL